jgi:hypothetical protein
MKSLKSPEVKSAGRIDHTFRLSGRSPAGITCLDHAATAAATAWARWEYSRRPLQGMAPPIPSQPIDQLPDIGNLHVGHDLTGRVTRE